MDEPVILRAKVQQAFGNREALAISFLQLSVKLLNSVDGDVFVYQDKNITVIVDRDDTANNFSL